MKTAEKSPKTCDVGAKKAQGKAMSTTSVRSGSGLLVLALVFGCGDDAPSSTPDGGIRTDDTTEAETQDAAAASGDAAPMAPTFIRMVDVPAPDPVSGPEPSFSDVQEVLMRRCATVPGCHSALQPANNLDLASDLYATIIAGRSTTTGKPLVVPGAAQQSYLYEKIAVDQPSDGSRMPLGPEPLTADEIASIGQWIESGAKQP